MKFQYFDAHTHVQFAAYDADRDVVIQRALEMGVAMVNVGTQKDTSRRAIEIAHEFERGPVYPVRDSLSAEGGQRGSRLDRPISNGVYATVGLHPIHADKSYHDPQELGEPFSNSRELENGQIKGFTGRGEDFDYEYYKKLALDPKVVAIGECGLDYFRIKNNESGIKEKQKAAFIKQIELAAEVKKPLMIHCRSAFSDLIQLLVTNYQLLITDRPGIIHFFSGTIDEAKRLLDMGFYFTFGGVITYPPKKNGTDYEAIIKIVPMDKILSETDAPYVAPAPYRGKRNEPAYVIEVVKKLAEVKDVPPEVMREQILENTRRVFKIEF